MGIVGECILDDRLVYDEIADDNLVVITPINSRFREMCEEHLQFHELLSEHFILRERSSATRQIFESALVSAGHNINRLKVLCEVESMDAALQFVKNGLGITVISEGAAREYIESHLVKKFYISDLELKRKIYMVRYSKKTLSPAAKAFKTFITSFLKDKKPAGFY
jgi:DNA-binding transcriptional LysR family regulator